MKSKAHLIILFIESILCIVMVFGRFSIPNPFATVISFPFVQISGLLRGLSLSSAFGNIMAIILYVLLCFSPWLLFIGKRRTRVLEDQLIIILPFVLLYAIYQMINPSALFLFNNLAMNNAILGLLIYSIIFSYFILRGKCRNCKTKISIQYPFIEALNGILYVLVFYIHGWNLISVV